MGQDLICFPDVADTVRVAISKVGLRQHMTVRHLAQSQMAVTDANGGTVLAVSFTDKDRVFVERIENGLKAILATFEICAYIPYSKFIHKTNSSDVLHKLAVNALLKKEQKILKHLQQWSYCDPMLFIRTDITMISHPQDGQQCAAIWEEVAISAREEGDVTLDAPLTFFDERTNDTI